MNVDRLRAVQAEEREADSLRPLPDAFYREVADYIEGLREERASAAAAADDPFGDQDVRRLTDEIETAEEVAEAIYERRVGKLVKRASLAAAGMSVDEEGLTTEEADLFADLVALIEDHRGEVFATFDRRAGSAAESPTETADPGGGSVRPETEEPPENGGGEPGDTPPVEDQDSHESEGEDSPGRLGGDSPEGDGRDDDPEVRPDGDDERVTLRITRDVGEVFGVDERVYHLAAEDVVSLPAANAEPLLARDAAERFD